MIDGIRVAAIAAVADNGAIGVDGDLPWHLPGDLRYFKRVTRGHAVIMGRKTWESLPRPLPKRLNVVLSRTLAPVEHPRVLVVRTPEAALAAAAEWERDAVREGRVDEATVMIVGGGGIYATFWPWTDRFYRTRVALTPEADAWFPAVDLTAFALSEATPGEGEPPHVFEVLERTPAT